MHSAMERTWEPYETEVANLKEKICRVRSDEHPDPGGLFHMGRRTGNEIPDLP